jgi:hypothetical protein
LLQKESDNQALIRQDGDGNAADIEQRDAGNYVDLWQKGYRSCTIVQEFGSSVLSLDTGGGMVVEHNGHNGIQCTQEFNGDTTITLH